MDIATRRYFTRERRYTNWISGHIYLDMLMERHAFGWEIRPSFSVSQNEDRAQVLRMYQKCFGCGYIRPDRSDKTLKYEVRSIDDLTEKVVPHFEKYPLLSGKKKDFEKFATICRMMNKGEHLKKEGFRKIVDLAFQINSSGKRRYSRGEIKI